MEKVRGCLLRGRHRGCIGAIEVGLFSFGLINFDLIGFKLIGSAFIGRFSRQSDGQRTSTVSARRLVPVHQGPTQVRSNRHNC